AGGFGVDLMLKDLGLAAEAALSARAALPRGARARHQVLRATAGGAGMDGRGAGGDGSAGLACGGPSA
ncbi:NAD-binding protein, partial [Achromobacter xylosoxidans]